MIVKAKTSNKRGTYWRGIWISPDEIRAAQTEAGGIEKLLREFAAAAGVSLTIGDYSEGCTDDP